MYSNFEPKLTKQIQVALVWRVKEWLHALYVAQDIGRLYEGRIIKANKMLQVVEKNRCDEIISLSKMSKSFVCLFC